MEMRSEALTFMMGFALAWRGVKEGVMPQRELIAGSMTALGEDSEMFKLVQELANELWPPFDPLPEPVKASKKGMTDIWEDKYPEQREFDSK